MFPKNVNCIRFFAFLTYSLRAMKKYFTIALLLMPLHHFAQTDFTRLSNYGVNDGLSQNSVYVIMQDSQGFGWVGTGDGLDRFDGKKFRIFRSREKDTTRTTLPGSIINSRIVEDREGRLWFNTNKGLVFLDKKTERFTIVGKKKANEYPFFISFMPVGIDGKDSLWGYISGTGIGAINIHDMGYTLYRTSIPLTPTNFNFIFHNGKIYITGKSGITCFDIRTHQRELLFSGQPVYCISPLPNGHLLIGGSGQLIDFNPETHISFTIKTNDENKSPIGWKQLVCSAADFSIGFSTKGNIYIIHEKNPSFSKIDFSHNPGATGLSDYLINYIFIDHSQNLWIGTEGAGLYIASLSKKKFNRYPEFRQERANLMVKGLYADEQNNILIGTYNQGLIIYNTHTKKTTHSIFSSDASGKPEPILFICRDSSGRVWLNSGNKVGYLKKDYSGFRFFYTLERKFKQNTAPVFPFAMLEIKKDEFLAGTNHGYYNFKTNKQGKIVSDSAFRIPDSYSGFVYSLKKGSDGSVFIGKIRGGFWRIQVTRQDIIRLDSAFLNTGIRDFYFCKTQPIVWIASEVGLIAYYPSKKTYRIFNESDGMSNQYIYGILAQNDQSLWFSTNRGINHAVVTYGVDHSIKKITFNSFTYNDGLQSNEFNSNAFYKSPLGDFIFGGVSGINWFNPDSVIVNPHPGIPAITGILCNDQPLNHGAVSNYLKSLTLSPQQNTLSFEFASLEFTNPETNLFTYRLKNVEKNWSSPDKNNTVKYANLPPGNYTFQLMASNNDGIWSHPLELKIKINPPFWETWWFRITVMVTLIFFVVLFTKIIAQRRLKRRIEKLEHLEALNQERERIAREMHDDIGAGLTQISLISENIKHRTGKSSLEKANEISDISRRMIGNISEIVWSLNPENRNFPQLIAYLREQVYKQLEYSTIDYKIQFPDKIPDVPLAPAQRRNILMITKEIVRNCIRHSGASKLIVKLDIVQNQLNFEISDNGSGFDLQQIRHGNGLKNIRKRLAELKGELNIDSSPGKGSTFHYSIPISTT
ncbi:MAG: hypothetical protein J0H55_16595 [Chitinophagaceae bacterium]|nr:hypothetical protein [Chitinophagaceae bacterium]